MFAPQPSVSAVRASTAVSLSPTRRRPNQPPYVHSPSRAASRAQPPRPPTPPDSDGEMDGEDDTLHGVAFVDEKEKEKEKWMAQEKQTFVTPLGFQLPIAASESQLPRYELDADEEHAATGGLPPSYSNSEKLEREFAYPTPAVSITAPPSAQPFFPSPEPSTASSVGSPPSSSAALLPHAPIHPIIPQHSHTAASKPQQHLHIHVPPLARSASPSPASATSRPLSAIVADKYGKRTTAVPIAHWLDTPAAWLALYFAFNLGLTLYNKGVLVKFPFPYTLTAVHALCGSIGCWIALELGYFTPQPLTRAEAITLGAFSVLYTVNIAVSNISLQLVTVPFHQVVRAATPLFTIALAATLLPNRGPPSRAKLLSLLPVVAGVGFATYGDYYFTAWGLFLTLLGTFLAACKTIVTNLLQSPPSTSAAGAALTAQTMPASAKRPTMLHSRTWSVASLRKLAKLSGNSFAGFRAPQLHPLDLLLRMSPLAFIQCIIYAYTSGELERVRAFGATEMTRGRATALMFNGIIAFGLNVVSFTANKRTGPLTMTVAANVKQVLTIVLAVMIFDLTITPTNLVGICLTLAGGAWYGAIEYGEKKRKSRA